MGMIIHESLITSTSADDVERLKKEEEYMNYINTHRENIKRAYETYLIPLLDKENISLLISDKELKDAITALKDQIEHHDDSKYADAEFNDYRAHWYPTNIEKTYDNEHKQLMDEKYEDAFKHHVKMNDHHPGHWVDDNGNPIDMTLVAILHMICDWESFSFNELREGIERNTIKWYEESAKDEKKAMTDNTRKLAEELLYRVFHNQTPPEFVSAQELSESSDIVYRPYKYKCDFPIEGNPEKINPITSKLITKETFHESITHPFEIIRHRII